MSISTPALPASDGPRFKNHHERALEALTEVILSARHAVAVAIPCLLVCSLPLPEGCDALPELRLASHGRREWRHRGGNGGERTNRNGNATERPEYPSEARSP